jgi:serine/threonine protein kinase
MVSAHLVLRRETELSSFLVVECPSLITFHGAFHRDAKIGIVLEYMDRGSLNDIIEEHFQVPEATLAAMTYQILIGLAYLHFDGRLHRDVKPSNILLNSRGEIKLSDFGIARELEAEGGFAETMVGTVKYMSPERLDGDLYGPPSDIWSLGIVLLELW